MKIKSIVFVLALMPSLGFCEDIGSPGGDYDFSNVDCNAPKTRRALIESYNSILKDNNSGLSVIDAYDQTTEKRSKNELQCVGTYAFSDGETSRVRYSAHPNSLGDLIDEFKLAGPALSSKEQSPGSQEEESRSEATYACLVDSTYQGERKRYMDQKGPWDQVITDYGNYFSWDLPRGNRGNSTGQDAYSGMDDGVPPNLNNKLLLKSTEKDGSTVEELRVNVSYHDGKPEHKFVYARRIKPSGIREYYVTDLTDKRAFMFLNCKQE
jgi:hypothetical protein